MALRHLGDFNLSIGAEKNVVEKETGSCVDFFVTLIRRATRRYVLGVRAIHGEAHGVGTFQFT